MCPGRGQQRREAEVNKKDSLSQPISHPSSVRMDSGLSQLEQGGKDFEEDNSFSIIGA